MTAILGEHDVTVHEGVEKNCRISKTVQHPGYNGQTKHDMMLAQIKCNVCFSLLSAENSKVGCIFPMIILSEFRMGQYRDDDHLEYAPHFTVCSKFKFSS